MKRFRYSIASLIGVVVFVAVGAAALRSSSDYWESGLFGATLLVLLVNILLAVHKRASKRAFWVGFGLFGGVYLILSLIPPIASRLPTTAGLTKLAAASPNSQAQEVALALDYAFISTATGTPGTGAGSSGTPTVIQGTPTSPGSTLVFASTALAPNVVGRQPLGLALSPIQRLIQHGGTQENFVLIGQSLVALIMAFLGGHISKFLAERGATPLAVEPSSRTESAPSA